MKNYSKSAKIMQIFIRICYVLLALLAILGTYLINIISGTFTEVILLCCIPFFLVLPAGYAVLICLDKLMENIKLNIVFSTDNTKLFKKISICCFYAAIIGILSCVSFIITDISYVFCFPIFILVCGEAFMGLIVMIIKSVFHHAIDIKNENDLTI